MFRAEVVGDGVPLLQLPLPSSHDARSDVVSAALPMPSEALEGVGGSVNIVERRQLVIGLKK